MRNRVQSLDRALDMLEMLAGAEHGGELGVTDLARRLDVHKSTASRLLATLQAHGLVEQSRTTEKYRLGPALVRLGDLAAGRDRLPGAAAPVLRELAERTRETVNLAVLRGSRVVNVDQVTAGGRVVGVDWVGKDTPLHCTSNGKALLAFLPEAERRRVLAGPLERMTDRTIVDAQTLEWQLAEVLVRGWAFTVEELEVGLNAVAAPVRDPRGRVVAAVSVAGPAYRMPPATLPELGALTRAAGEAITRRLGRWSQPWSEGEA